MTYIRRMKAPHVCLVPQRMRSLLGDIWKCDDCDQRWIFVDSEGPLLWNSSFVEWYKLEVWDQMLHEQQDKHEEYNRRPWYMKYFSETADYWYTRLSPDSPVLNYEL